MVWTKKTRKNNIEKENFKLNMTCAINYWTCNLMNTKTFVLYLSRERVVVIFQSIHSNFNERSASDTVWESLFGIVFIAFSGDYKKNSDYIWWNENCSRKSSTLPPEQSGAFIISKTNKAQLIFYIYTTIRRKTQTCNETYITMIVRMYYIWTLGDFMFLSIRDQVEEFLVF